MPDARYKRVNVAITEETAKALRTMMDKEGVTLTEAVRRLTGYGEFLYRKIKDEGATVLVKTGSKTREVELLG